MKKEHLQQERKKDSEQLGTGGTPRHGRGHGSEEMIRWVRTLWS